MTLTGCDRYAPGMSLLNDLGVGDGAGSLLLASAPDALLAEAGRLKPRPTFASGLMTAEPADRIAWWPDGRTLNAGTLSRLRWMLASAGGEGWLVFDAEDQPPAREPFETLLAAAGLALIEDRPLAGGGRAYHVRPQAAIPSRSPSSDS